MPAEWSPQRQVWRDHAACIGKPTQWFFAAERAALIELALMTCAGCAVRERCLTDALDYELGDRVIYGVRGGIMASERVELVRQRAVEVVAEAEAGLREVFAAAI